MWRAWFERQWQQSGWAQCVLLPISWLFSALAACRRGLYRSGLLASHALPVPVIIVGNISVGGVGKTPMVLWLAEQLRQAGYQPGILSRGYGGQHTGEVKADSDPRLLGDEPVLLAQRSLCPVWVDADRVRGGHALLQAYPACNVVLCDDGLQHYALQRTIEIAVVQRPLGIGNQRLLPAGPLREPLGRLSQVDLIVESGELPASQPAKPGFTLQLRSGDWHNVMEPSQRITTAVLRNAQPDLLAMAGIGHPQRFFNTLSEQSLQFETRVFPDHHVYSSHDFAGTAQKTILMTEKDAVKCRHLQVTNAWYLPIEAELHPIGHAQPLLSCVLELLQQRKGIRI